ncbi:MAG: hypothetical protein R2849_07865 [Thermomicrobiales bacterium]
MRVIVVLRISACSKVAIPESGESAPDVDWQVIDALAGGLAPTVAPSVMVRRPTPGSGRSSNSR